MSIPRLGFNILFVSIVACVSVYPITRPNWEVQESYDEMWIDQIRSNQSGGSTAGLHNQFVIKSTFRNLQFSGEKRVSFKSKSWPACHPLAILPHS